MACFLLLWAPSLKYLACITLQYEGCINGASEIEPLEAYADQIMLRYECRESIFGRPRRTDDGDASHMSAAERSLHSITSLMSDNMHRAKRVSRVRRASQVLSGRLKLVCNM